MYWQQDGDSEAQYRSPEDIFDLVFKLQGSNLFLDHAFALAQALQQHLSVPTCNRIGVHGIRMAESGNGWISPAGKSTVMPLSQRAKLVIRLHQDDFDEVSAMVASELDIGGQPVKLGSCSIRKLSTMATLFSRGVKCDKQQSEEDFLNQVAARLKQLNINVSKMICGKSGEINAGNETIFTRTLLVADLKPPESIALQRRGLGGEQILGCGLFVAHKGIDAVYDMQK